MTTRLRSLRVTADLDAAGYARGAQQKVAADQAMISSGDRFGASLATADQSLQKLPAGMARLSRMWISGYSETEKFEKAIRQVGNAIDKGMNLDRAVTMLKQIETQFGRTANAAQLAKQGFVSVGPALATAQVDQSGLNSLLGMKSGSGRSAQDSAAVFQAAAAEQESMAASAKALRSEIDPLGTAQARLNAELLEYRALANAGVISTHELAMAQDMATAKFDLVSKNIAATGQHFRLARHEVANLSYQLNDVAVMLASGQAPFMLFMQQGMQIGQLLGPRGLGNAVKALGVGIVSFLTNPVNLAVVAFAAAAAGAAYLFRLMKSDLPTIEELLKKQKALLDELKESYADIGLEIGRMASASVSVIRFEVGINVEQSRERLNKDLETLMKTMAPTPYAAKGRGVMINPEFMPFLEEIRELQKGLKTGEPDIQRFRENIAALPVPVGMTAKAFNELRMKAFDATKELDKFDRSTDQLSLSLDPLASKLSNLFAMKPTDLLGNEPSYSNLQNFIPETRSQREQLDETHKAFVRLFGDTKFLALETVKYKEAIAAVNMELTKTKLLNNLDIQSIYARSPAQKAAIAAEREWVTALNTGVKGTEMAIREQHAYRQALEEATFAITEQNRARLNAANDNISNAQLELKLVGASAAEQGKLRANLASYLDLKKQAEDNGLEFDQAQYELLKKKNAEAALYIELTARQTLATELDNERRYSGMSPRESDIQKQLLGTGIEEGTAAWQDFHDEILKTKEAQDSVFYGFKTGFDQIRSDANDFATSMEGIVTDLYGGMEDALVEFVKTGKVNFQSLTDQMIEDVTRLAYKLAMSGMLNMLIGGSAQNTSGYGGMLGSLFKAPGLYGKGDVFDSPTPFSYGGGRMGVMGENGPEAVVPLARGRDGKLGIAGGGTGGVRITHVVNNYSSKATARNESREDGNGGIDMITIIEDVTIKTMSGHKGQSLMSAQYGVGRQARSR